MAYYELLNSRPDPVAVDTQVADLNEPEYDVEVILKARCRQGRADDVTHTGSKTIPGHWDYFVKWGGYDDSWNSWQAPGTIDCTRLIKEFWDDFDFDELTIEDIVDGVVYASQEWIDYQKAYFANHYTIITIDDTPVIEEIYDPHAEPGSSSEEEDEDMDEEDDEEELEPAAQEDNVLDEICAAREFEFQHMYPSPMSMIMEDDTA